MAANARSPICQCAPGCRTCNKFNVILLFPIIEKNMIIVFFHVLYLIGKMVYENYHSAKRKDKANVEAPLCVPAKISEKHHGDIPDTVYDDENGPRAPRFSPPAYIQRYIAVQKVLADPRYKGKIKKVVDFGCSELGFVTHLKNTPGIQEIVCVDIDRETLDYQKDKVIPLNVDYLRNRPYPLTICVYEGSVTHGDKKLENSDAVVAIELIEHLYPDTLMDLPYNIFGYIKPLVVAITTPNAEFNVLFPKMEKKFRHWDHKFEWTRDQFQDWAKNITSRYPDYHVSFQGIGPGPPGTEEFGCCSQMAVFARLRESDCLAIYGTEGLLKTVTTQEYPHRIDNRSDEEKILDEAAYYIRQYTYNNSESLEEYPIAYLLRHLEKFYISAATLREILENGGYAVIDHPDGPAVACPAVSTFSDYDEEMDNDEWPDYLGEPSNYQDEIGTWGSNNVQAAYEDSWDDDCQVPVVVSSRDNEQSNNVQAPDRSNIPEIELSGTRSLDTADLDDLVIFDVSHVPSASGSLESERLTSFLEIFDSNINHNENQNDSQAMIGTLESNRGIAAIDLSTSSIKSPRESSCASNNEELAFRNDDTIELGSLCSMYLEASRNEDNDVCPENMTNPRFKCERLSLPCSNASTNPQLTSSPRVSLELRDEPKKSPTADKYKSVGETSLRSNGNSSSATMSTGLSLTTMKKWYPPEVNPMYSTEETVNLKGGNELSDEPIDEITSESGEISPSDSFIEVEQENLHVTRLQRLKAPESLKLPSTTTSGESIESLPNFPGHGTNSKNDSRRSDNVIASEQLAIFVDSIAKTADQSDGVFAHRSGGSRLAEVSETAEAKPASPDAPETPPDSWSPEIMDSGYPNSSSTQDMTPEYDLSSIAQDRISDSESPSVAEAPRLGFLEHADVRNGDLANNNRDGEGNNMMAEAENVLDQDLQPLIDVLENDMENENDIYALENDFPMWLLRILERGNAAVRQAVAELEVPEDALEADAHAAGDAGLPDNDEGFDSTSSENDDSEVDDDNIEEISTESSEETIDWNASGDYH